MLEEMKVRASNMVVKRLEIIGRTVLWMTLPFHTIDGTTLSKEEWRDNVRIRYEIHPSGLYSW